MSLIEDLESLERMEIRQEPRPVTLWDTVKSFFNEKLEEGVTIVDREQLISYVRDMGDFRRAVESARWGSSSIDTYRNYLDKAGYLRRIRNGVYEIIEQIPSYLTIEYAKEKAYTQSKKKKGRIGWSKGSTKKKKSFSFIKENEFSV